MESRHDERDSLGEDSRDRLVRGGAHHLVAGRVNSDNKQEGGIPQVVDVRKAGSSSSNGLSWPLFDELSMWTRSVDDNFKLPKHTLNIGKCVNFNLGPCFTLLGWVASHNHDQVAADVIGDLGQGANPWYLRDSNSSTDCNVKKLAGDSRRP